MAGVTSQNFLKDVDVVTVNGGFTVVLFTIVLFTLLNRLVNFIGTPSVVVSNAKNKEESWKWRNLTLSWIHALIIGTWDLSCFYFYPEVWQDLIAHISPYTYYMVAVSTGYFIYDFLDLLLQRRLFKEWELSLHHVAVISIFVYNLWNRTCIGYTAVALLTEVNSIFLHLRKLMQMLRLPFCSLSYRLNALMNLGTFLVCRGYCLARITYGMVIERSRLGTRYLCLLGGAMFIMNLINPALFVILLRNDVLRPPSPKKSRNQLDETAAKANGQQNGRLVG